MIIIDRSFRENDVSISVKGHANFGEHGSDIVCSAVSILICTLAQRLRVMKAEGKVKIKKEVLEGDEKRIDFNLFPAGIRDYRCLDDTILTGLVLLQNQYPENVKLVTG